MVARVASPRSWLAGAAGRSLSLARVEPTSKRHLINSRIVDRCAPSTASQVQSPPGGIFCGPTSTPAGTYFESGAHSGSAAGFSRTPVTWELGGYKTVLASTDASSDGVNVF